MKKSILLIVSILMVIVMLGACGNSESTVTPSPAATNPDSGAADGRIAVVSGRIIETVDGEYTTIRNETDTSIYYRIDISAGLAADSGVSTDLEPNNVIGARVEILDEEAIPITTRLISLTVNTSPDYKVIDTEQAKAMIDAGDVIILDVRTREEYESGYIKDSFNLPLGTIESGIQKITSDKDAVLLVYCRSGNRSKVAARELTELGYTNVYDFGGIVDWTYGIVEP
jgi:rhodanese-related sulfurtransferase